MNVNDAKDTGQEKTGDIGYSSRQPEQHQSHVEFARLEDRRDESERSGNLTQPRRDTDLLLPTQRSH